MHILVMSFTDLAKDQRVNRQIRFLAARHKVTALGSAPPQISGVDFIPVKIRPRSLPGKAMTVAQMVLRLEDKRPWHVRIGDEVVDRLSRLGADLYVVNDMEPLPLALSIAEGRPVILDAHEYYPRRFEDRLTWRLLRNPYSSHLCRRLIPQTAGVLTVCTGLADQYERDTGIRPLVVTNAPDYSPLEPVSRSETEPIRMVYHGLASKSRRIEETIRIMEWLDSRFRLDLYLVPGDHHYIERLTGVSAGDPRISIRPPMPASEIVQRTHGYDVGLFLLPPTSWSYLHALPNKFFEYVQARMAVAVGPSPEMAPLVRTHDLGIVSEEFTSASMARALSALDHSRINAFKNNSHAVAYELSSAANRTTLLAFVDRVMAESGSV